MKLHALSIIGFIVLNIGFWPMFAVLASRGALGSSMASMSRAIAAFRTPAGGLETLLLWGGPLVIALGAVLTLAGVAAGDAGQRSSCRDICKEKGFEDGLMRGNPHVKRPGETPRQCWCHNGSGRDTRWAKKGHDLPTGR